MPIQLTKENVKKVILEAFQYVQKGSGLGARECSAQDDYALPEEVAKAALLDTEEHWWQYPEDLVQSGILDYSLIYNNEDGVKFHLPAVMTAEIDNHGNTAGISVYRVLCYAHTRKVWEMPGGGRDEGESFEECIIREIKEESNMKVLELFPLGYETFTNTQTGDTNYTLRYAAIVEPYGDFVQDTADGEITEIKLVDPADYKQYFDWGERGDVLMLKAKKCTRVA